MSERLFKGLLAAPLTTRLRFELSNKASTASCSILFSLRIMMSGALSLTNRSRRLFLLIQRRYRSLRSLVANLPPSSWTIGLRSGGMTGITVSIIHSGLLPLSRKFSQTSILLSRRLSALSAFWRICSRSSRESSSRSRLMRSLRTASAPMPASKESPYCSRASQYSSSLSSCLALRLVSPALITTYFS